MSSYGGMAAIDPSQGQYIEVPVDQSGQYIIQDAAGINSVQVGGMVTGGKSLLKPELSQHGGYKNNDSRWVNQGVSRGGKVMSRKPVGMQSAALAPPASGLLSLGSRYTPSSATALSSAAQSSSSILGSNASIINSTINVDRMANALAGTASRGRPRDMVRQLGIEQQVILQPAAPVAMRNKSILCRPLSMSRRTQAEILHSHTDCQTDDLEMHVTEVDSKASILERLEKKNKAVHSQESNEEEKKIVYIPVPIAVPIYIPVPVHLYAKPMPYAVPMPLPIPFPLGLFLDSQKEGAKFAEDIMQIGEVTKEVPKQESKKESGGGQKRAISRTSIQSSSSLSSKRSRGQEHTEEASPIFSYHYGVNAWNHWIKSKANSSNPLPDILTMTDKELNENLTIFIKEVKKPNSEIYYPDSLFYLCLGIQNYLRLNGSKVNIFDCKKFRSFTLWLSKILSTFEPRLSSEGILICRLKEQHLWESEVMGLQDPNRLTFTLIYFNTKHFGLLTEESHEAVSFANFEVKDGKLLFKVSEKISALINRPKEIIIEISPNVQNIDHCPVKFYETYIAKCAPESVAPHCPFYLNISESSSTNQWYTSKGMKADDIQLLLNRVKMVKEIQEVSMDAEKNVHR